LFFQQPSSSVVSNERNGMTTNTKDGTNNATVSLQSRYEAAKYALSVREGELLELKGPCADRLCRLHYAHKGPCHMRKDI
jgi:hypothetical protein